MGVQIWWLGPRMLGPRMRGPEDARILGPSKMRILGPRTEGDIWDYIQLFENMILIPFYNDLINSLIELIK